MAVDAVSAGDSVTVEVTRSVWYPFRVAYAYLGIGGIIYIIALAVIIILICLFVRQKRKQLEEKNNEKTNNSTNSSMSSGN